MKRKMIKALAFALLIVALSASAIFAAGSENFLVARNSLGGGGGGDVSRSENFVLVSGYGGPVETSLSSDGFHLCTGFVCNGDTPITRVYLPVVEQ